MNDAQTLPALLARNASRWPHRAAWRHKRLGIWQTLTWAAFARRCNDIALGLAANGFGQGDRLAALGDNCPELYAAMLAAQSLGGAGVPLDPESQQKRLAGILEDARVSIAIADTADQAGRLLAAAESLVSPPRLFCADTGGFYRHDVWEKSSVDVLVEEGRGRRSTALPPPDLGPLRGPSPQGEGELHVIPASQDVALLLYPPDADFHPLPLSHAQLISAAAEIAAADPVRPTDEAFCYLSISSYEDALYSLTLGLLGGFACNCPEAPDSVPRDLREIGPTILFAPTAACNALAHTVASKAESATGFKRRSFAFFQRLALQAETLREQGQAVPLTLAILCRIGEFAAYAPVRDQLGLSRARWVHADGPLPPNTARLLRALGVALRPATVRAAAPGPAQETPETLHA